MKNFSSLLVCVVVLASLAAGCGGDPYRPRRAMQPPPAQHEKLILLDERVQRSVTCTGIQERVLEDGRLEISAKIRNRETRRVAVQAACVFKDAAGIAAGGAAAFQLIEIPERGEATVAFTAPAKDTRKYTLRIRATP